MIARDYRVSCPTFTDIRASCLSRVVPVPRCREIERVPRPVEPVRRNPGGFEKCPRKRQGTEIIRWTGTGLLTAHGTYAFRRDAGCAVHRESAVPRQLLAVTRLKLLESSARSC